MNNLLILTKKTKYKTEANFLFSPFARISAVVARGSCGAVGRRGGFPPAVLARAAEHPQVLASAAGTGPAGSRGSRGCSRSV